MSALPRCGTCGLQLCPRARDARALCGLVANPGKPAPRPFHKVVAENEAAMMAALSSLVELRLLIAAVDDVLLAPAAPLVPIVFGPEDPVHLARLESQVRHRTAVQRLGVSQQNARASLRYFDAFREDKTEPPAPAPATEPAGAP